MSLTLYFHPLSSFCQKVLVALYEGDVPFTPHLVNLMEEREVAAFRRIWPIGKFPVLRDEGRDLTVPESTIIIEYLARHHRAAAQLVPADAELAWRIRAADRFYDLNVNVPMQKIITDRLRPAGQGDALGVAQARAQLEAAFTIIETEMADRAWAIGDAFTMADCAAAPALYYANLVVPFEGRFPVAAAYLGRLMRRRSFARVVEEAAPYRGMIPREPQT
jgi:glutathione S-transferase